MAHGIVKPYDVVFSTKSPEWHGLANVRETIGEIERERVSFPIIEGEVAFALENGGNVPLSGWKALAADLRNLPEMEDVDTIPVNDAVIPLYIPRDSYTVISNGAFLEAMDKALDGVPYKILTMGTLLQCKRFFCSVELEGDEFKEINGDKIMPYLNFITSHDGTTNVRLHDNGVRIVCNNTFEWSLNAIGALDFSIKHTLNAQPKLTRVAEVMNDIFHRRTQFVEAMGEFITHDLTVAKAEAITAGYFAYSVSGGIIDNVPDAFSTRSANAIEEITRLFAHGRGNKGASLYDLWNGATEYWSEGDGTGKGANRTPEKKVFSSIFGRGMEHKNVFRGFLETILAKDAETKRFITEGTKALKEYRSK